MKKAAMNNGLIAKAAAVSAAVIMAAGIPAAIHFVSGSSSAAMSTTESTAITTAAVAGASNDTARAEQSSAEKSADELSAADTKSEGEMREAKKEEKAIGNVKIEDDAEGNIAVSNAPVSKTADDESKTENTSVPAVVEDGSEGNIEISYVPQYTDTETVSEYTAPAFDGNMSVDRMLSLSSEELRALSGNDFETVPAACSQCAAYGIKCSEFPEYVFVVNIEGVEAGAPENKLEVAGAGCYEGSKYILGDHITQLELYNGAEICDGVKVGMRYSELKDLLGSDLLVEATGTSLSLAAPVEIDGRKWLLHFDLTDEQVNAVYDEFSTHYEYIEDEDGNKVLVGASVWGLTADLSDIDPVCDIAVHIIR